MDAGEHECAPWRTGQAQVQHLLGAAAREPEGAARCAGPVEVKRALPVNRLHSTDSHASIRLGTLVPSCTAADLCSSRIAWNPTFVLCKSATLLCQPADVCQIRRTELYGLNFSLPTMQGDADAAMAVLEQWKSEPAMEWHELPAAYDGSAGPEPRDAAMRSGRRPTARQLDM